MTTELSANARLAALFPESDGPGPRPWWRHKARIAIAAVVVIVLVATTVIATSAFGSDAASYRTATVGTQNVNSLLTGVATVEPVSQAAVAFPTSGTVATVDVAVGQVVTAGQALASLDTQSLTTTLHEKEAALAQAQLKLSKALSGESVGSPSNAGSGTSIGSSTGSSSGIRTTAATNPTGVSGLAAAQQAVLAAQHQVDLAITAANAAMTAATTVCTAAGVGGGGTTTSTTSTTLPSTADLTACQTAIAAVQTAQQQVSAAQTQLAHASTALETLLQQQASSASSGTGSSGATGSTGPTGSAGAATGAKSGVNTGGTGAASSSPSSADLVAYQQAVDAATLDVAVAAQTVAQATITSPINGTVVAVNLTPRESVTSASSTENIIVTGPGGYEVTTTVSVDQIIHVKVGQPATLVPDGSQHVLTGKVVAISGQPDATTTTGTTPTYRVVVGLDDPNAKLNNGASATVSIVTDRATSALAVPTSAVTTTGTRHTVNVVDGGDAKLVAVRVGVVGDRYTEITSGLTAGQQIVLATVNEPLPSSATSSSNGTTRNGFGGLGGAGGTGAFRLGGFGGGGTGGAVPRVG